MDDATLAVKSVVKPCRLLPRIDRAKPSPNVNLQDSFNELQTA
jgi:hypothetical protein